MGKEHGRATANLDVAGGGGHALWLSFSALRQYIWLLYTTPSFRHREHSHELTNLWYATMTIFYQGSLQEGIALAVREAKAVVCFVRGRYLPAS